MRIAYLTQWFDPEPNVIKGIAFVRALMAAGHKVTVVTGLPNYPHGRLYPGYRLRIIQRETIGGVDVVRLPLYPSHDRSAVRRSLNYLSFGLALLLYLLVRRRRFDLAYVYHPPITVGFAAALAGRLRRLPFLLDIQDLWPDTLAATGMAGSSRLRAAVDVLCRFTYRRAAAILVQSDGIRRALAERGVPPGKLTRIYNWADGAEARPEPVERPQGETLELLYAGNLGRAQGLETMIAAAERLAGEPVTMRLVGDGVERQALEARLAATGVSGVAIEPPVPALAVKALAARSDALLIHLADDPLFRITIPSKVQACLALGRPIIAGIGGEAAGILLASGAALVAPPGDPDALAAAIRRFAALPPAERTAMGARGRAFYERNFAFGTGMAETLALIAGTNQRMDQGDRRRA